jgi:hypothetical protein
MRRAEEYWRMLLSLYEWRALAEMKMIAIRGSIWQLPNVRQAKDAVQNDNRDLKLDAAT